MNIARLLPEKFSSRLFLITFAAGFIPLIIFAILLEIHGREFQPQIRRTIEEAQGELSDHSRALLIKMGESALRQKALDVAAQIGLTFKAYPYMTLLDFQKDKRFRELAVQKVGKTGYTALHESDTGIVRFHRDRRIENKHLASLSQDASSIWSVVKTTLGRRQGQGYYTWYEPDGAATQKYIYVAPVDQPTADGIFLSVGVTAYVDEFTRPVLEAEAINRRTTDHIAESAEKMFRAFRRRGLILMGIGMLTISCIAFAVGSYFSRAITRLRVATRKVNEGNFAVSVKPPMSGEVRTLTEDFNRMVAQLAATTVSKVALEDSEGRLLKANAKLYREIEERRKVQEALAQEKERLSVTLRSIGDGVVTTDRSGRIVLMNPTASDLTGWEPTLAEGRPLEEVFHTIFEDTRATAPDPAMKVIEGGEAVRFPRSRILMARDGQERVVSLSGAPIVDKDGIMLGTIIVFRDMTELRKMEHELLKMSKLESIGTLAGGIAHDFNNLLAVVLGNVSLAKMLLEPDGKAYQRLAEAEKGLVKGKELTYRLLTFARGGEPVRRVVPLQNLIAGSADLSFAGSNIAARILLPPDLGKAEVDENQMRQVFYNILTNAREAMPGGGTVTIVGENISLGAEAGIPLPEGDYVKISVTDEGTGIPPEDIQRIFDPYFTSKDRGNEKGMGLGLAICYSVVKGHGGFIAVESVVGKGTTLNLYLPAHKEEVRSVAAQPLPPPGPARILFMDDEDAIRDVAGQILTHLGHTVAFARDGAEALRLYTEHLDREEPFDLVIMDLTIQGGMGGKETMERLRKIDPPVKAIVTSGYSNDPILNRYTSYGFAGSISKPFKIEELNQVIARVTAQ